MPKRIKNIGKITSGGWDQTGERFEEHIPQYRIFIKRYVKNKDWQEIEEIQEIRSRVSSGDLVWNNCSTREQVDDRLKHLDKLYNTIYNEGYKSQKELVEEALNDPLRSSWDAVLRKSWHELDEIAVDIGREGELLFVDTRHRAALAKIIGVESVPIRIVTRHTEWVEFGEKIHDYAETNDLRYKCLHPDLREVPFEYDISGLVHSMTDHLVSKCENELSCAELYGDVAAPFTYNMASKYEDYKIICVTAKDVHYDLLSKYHPGEARSSIPRNLNKFELVIFHMKSGVEPQAVRTQINALESTNTTIVIVGHKSDIIKMSDKYTVDRTYTDGPIVCQILE